MTFRHTMSALAVVLAAGAAGSVMAGSQEGSKAKLGKIDQNNDGVVTLEELRANSEAWFSTVDVDGDGVITREEIRSARQARIGVGEAGQMTEEEFMERVRAGADLDQDEMIHEDEAAADFGSVFAMLDLDGDGVISQEEWDQQLEFSMADLDDDGDNQVTRAEFMGYGKEAYARAAAEGEVTTDIYAERVRVISGEEEMAAWRERFNRLDEDDDGVLVEDELAGIAEGGWANIPEEQEKLATPGDEDVQIPMDDVVALTDEEFENADLDDDGTVTVWEYRSYALDPAS